jgi:hypothetical protein
MQKAKVRGVLGLFKHESEEGVDPRFPISNFLCESLSTLLPILQPLMHAALKNKGRYCMGPPINNPDRPCLPSQRETAPEFGRVQTLREAGVKAIALST